MSVDFGNYTAEKEDGNRPVEFIFHRLKGAPGIMSRPATEANERYHSNSLKKINKITRAAQRKKLSRAEVNKNRKEDAATLAKFCITGWSKGHEPVDIEGDEVPFSEENAREFLLAIPGTDFDDYRRWVIDVDNFREDAEDEDEDEDEDDEEEPTMGESQTSTASSSNGVSDASVTDTP